MSIRADCKKDLEARVGIEPNAPKTAILVNVLCAAAILFRPAADIVRFARLGTVLD
jgi:hypothetical protein